MVFETPSFSWRSLLFLASWRFLFLMRPAGYSVPVVKPLEDLLVPGTRLGGRYVIEGRLGGGAMGSVYAAAAPDGRRVAIKALLAAAAKGDAAERRARFLREAAVCATLAHPNVVPVVDHGIDEPLGLPFLVMPLLTGEDLAAVLDRVGMLEPNVAIALAVQACDGLAAAHARGVVHRDVKPSNLFLLSTPTSDTVTVMVSDFGLAKSLDQVPGSPGALTGTGRFMGTPQYVSPEQAISAKHVDLRTDVYGLAMSLYHALCGRPAFAYVRSFMGLVLELTAREAPHIQDAAPWVPPAVARIVHAALLKDPAARCPSAGELALALDMAVGIDTSRRPVTRADLAAASAATQATLSPRAQLGSSWEDVLRV
jgi:serine/threonine protein kinase